MLRRFLFPLVAIVAVLLLTSCGDDAGSAAPAATDETESTTESQTADEADTTDETEEAIRIISLSPSSTEILFAIGAGDRVVAVDEFSYYPPEAPITDLSGYTPNVESILAYEPTLLVWQGGPDDVAASLEAAGVVVLNHFAATTFEDIYAQMAELGALTGNEAEAGEQADAMRSRIAELAASVQAGAEPVTYYHELGTELYSATSTTFIGQVYGLAGMVNIADAADPDGEFYGYPQLSEEFVLAADPDIIFLADTIGYGQTVQTLTERPGWDSLSAVKEGNVVELNDDAASRWGPRVLDFAEAVVAAANKFNG